MTTIYLSDRDLAARYGVSRGTIWRWVRTRRYPAPVRIGEAVTRWRMDAVTEWEAARPVRRG